MCGIFGIISKKKVNLEDLNFLVEHSQQRGKDSSGLVIYKDQKYSIERADFAIEELVKKVKLKESEIVTGHSRLITNGLADNQPVVRDDIIVLHNGIIVNDEDVWKATKLERRQEIDTEVIAAITQDLLLKDESFEQISERILSLCKGVIATAIILPKLGKLLLFSNNGSLYRGDKEGDIYFASESYPLVELNCKNVTEVRACNVISIPSYDGKISVVDRAGRQENLIPKLILKNTEEDFLVYPKPIFKRCSKCILPETMPFIDFDEHGVCNYCRNYRLRNVPKPKEQIFELVEKYRREHGNDAIVPFSGGRDSCYGLHLIVNELKMKPVTYTYDWGMVTDLGRRNISRMCAELGVENIIVADDISQKRKNIQMNLRAWLKAPHLGMISLLTAGDKHFFRHVETIKKQTGISLNLWGVNPLEVTHFKTGFLGIEPDFVSNKVYTHGALKQLRYHVKRFGAMTQSLGYFNSSLWDTLSGEYYRSFTEKLDYYHIFDYWRWDEKVIEDTLDSYDWERAPDTKTTWRIGDGTAAFYNYVYFTVAGFTEHDTFRSNQIREGELTREEALVLCEEENTPRYPNIKWYLDTVGIDFKEAIKVVNSMPRLYHEG